MARNTLLFHLSDIHFGLEDNEALDWVQAEIATRRPAAVARRVGAGDLAVLVRTNALLDDFASGLQWAGIPYAVNAGRSFFTTPEVKDRMAAWSKRAQTTTKAMQSLSRRSHPMTNS